MNDQQNRNALAIPGDFAAKLMAGIAQSRATTQMGAGGKQILRLLKGGLWVFGQTSEEVQPGSKWVVNPMTLAHGWCCWVEGETKNTLAGDVMVSMSEWLPPQPTPVDGYAYKEQRAVELKCITGEDTGTEVVYKVNSYGGIQAFTGLISAIQQRLTTPHPCPVLVLDSEYYQHPKWGRVDKPILSIVAWADMYGQVEGSAPAPVAAPVQEPAAAPAPPPPPPSQPVQAPARKKKPPLAPDAPAAAPAAAQAAPQPAPAHTGQRRRPGAR